MSSSNPSPEECFELANRNGGSVMIVGITEEEADWARGYGNIYGTFGGFTFGLFVVTNDAKRLEKPTMFFGRDLRQIELAPEQRSRFDSDWEHHLAFSQWMDWEAEHWGWSSSEPTS